MNKFNILDLEIIRNANTPSTTIKRQISNMLECSEECFATVERVEKNTGRYRIVLEGKLVEKDNTKRSFVYG